MTDPALFSVKDRVVIVTGASRGIGRAVAEGLLDASARVVFVARSPDMLERVGQLPSDRALAIQCDVTDAGAAERICDAALKTFGRIDVLINNAGIAAAGDDPYSESAWDRILAVDLKAVFLLSRAVVKVMKEHGGGSIINIASIGCMLGFPGNPAYQAAKGGVRQLTKAMALDWAADNVRVNAICPGYFRAAMSEQSYADLALRRQRTERTMLGRWGRAEELVGPCIFLASAASSYITGCDLPVDGGWTAKGM